MFKLWKKYSFAIGHVLSVIGIAVAIYGLSIARDAIEVISENSVSAEAKIQIFRNETQKGFQNVLREASAEAIVKCEEAFDNGTYKLFIEGRSGFYPSLVYNVELSYSAYRISKEIEKMLFHIDRLNSTYVTALSVDVRTLGWADRDPIRRGAPYEGAVARCIATDLNGETLPIVLQNGDLIDSNVELACARAADFNRSAGVGSILPGRAALFGEVSDDQNVDGSSRGVNVEISISGFTSSEHALKLCPASNA